MRTIGFQSQAFSGKWILWRFLFHQLDADGDNVTMTIYLFEFDAEFYS